MKVMTTLMVIVTSTLIGEVTRNEAEEESDDSADGKGLTTLTGRVSEDEAADEGDDGNSDFHTHWWGYK